MSGTSWALVIAIVVVLAFKLYMGRRSPEQIQKMQEAIAAGGLLLDVRSPGEFSGHHLPGAVNIPVGELGARLGELGDTERAIVVYCASGARSKAASQTLLQRGYSQVYDLGSWRNWPE